MQSLFPALTRLSQPRSWKSWKSIPIRRKAYGTRPTFASPHLSRQPNHTSCLMVLACRIPPREVDTGLIRRVRAFDSHFIADVCCCQKYCKYDSFHNGVVVATERATAACLSPLLSATQLLPAIHTQMMFLGSSRFETCSHLLIVSKRGRQREQCWFTMLMNTSFTL
jgi:hypothetical protein